MNIKIIIIPETDPFDVRINESGKKDKNKDFLLSF